MTHELVIHTPRMHAYISPTTPVLGHFKHVGCSGVHFTCILHLVVPPVSRGKRHQVGITFNVGTKLATGFVPLKDVEEHGGSLHPAAKNHPFDVVPIRCFVFVLIIILTYKPDWWASAACSMNHFNVFTSACQEL